MKITPYQSQQLPSGQGGLVHALGGERRSAPRVPDMSARWQGMADFAESITKIGERMQEAERVQEFSDAIVKSNVGLADLMERIKTDERFINAGPEEHEKYYTEQMGQLRDNITEGMKSRQARDAFASQFAAKQVSGLVRVRDLGRQRQIDRGRASTDGQLTELANNMIRTGDETAINEGLAIIEGKVAAGYFSPTEGAELKKRYLREAVYGYWERRIQDAPGLVYDMLKQSPSSLKHLEESDKTRLLKAAKQAAETDGRKQQENRIYAEMIGKYGDDYGKAAEWLEDPDHYKSLDLQSRRYLMATFEGMRAKQVQDLDLWRRETGLIERRQINELMLAGKPDQALDIARNSKALDPSYTAALMEKARSGKDYTSPEVYATLIRGIHSGTVSQEAQIDDYRLAGLSNDDADSLVAKLGQGGKRYNAVLDYAESKYKALYPAKDDIEKHLKWYEFVLDMDKQFDAEAKLKGRPLTDTEARQVVDAWLDEQTAERSFWFDRTYRPWWEKQEKQGIFKHEPGSAKPAPLSPVDRAALIDLKIPLEIQDIIARTLEDNGFEVTSENIYQFWLNNKDRLSSMEVTGGSF